MGTHKHIIRLALLVILTGMTMAPAMAQTNTVYAGQTTPLTVVDLIGDSYSWELYNEGTGINFAVVPGNCPASEAFFQGGINTGSSVNVTWLKPGEYFFKVTAVKAGCTDNLNVGKITVLEFLPTAILAVNPSQICVGDTANILVTFTGTEPWNFRLRIRDNNGSVFQDYPGITAFNNPFSIQVNPLITTEYAVMEVTDKFGSQKNPSDSVTLTVNPMPTNSPIYVKSPLPYTPMVVNDPYIIDKVCKGSFRNYRINGEQNSTYTWILRDSGGNVVPLANSAGTAFSDTDTNSNPIYGSEIQISWNVDPAGYTLTAEQVSDKGCLSSELGTVMVVQAIVSAGSDLTICSGSLITLNEATASDYATLEWTTSGDGIFSDKNQMNPIYTPGPADLNGGTINLTLTATGAGNEGSCTPVVDGLTVTLENIVAAITANPDPPVVCRNTEVVLQTSVTGSTSTVTHSWTGHGSEYLSAGNIANPVFGNAAPAGIYTLTYTAKNLAGCETSASITITVNETITAQFDPIGTICLNSSAPALPATSTNGITGSWNPAIVSNTASGTYTFTPDAGQCASGISIDITVTPETLPIFNPIGVLCQDAKVPELPAVSTNGISGTWSPATITTAAAGTFSFTFTPDAGQCATTSNLSVTVNPTVTPDFTAIPDICSGTPAPALPTTSNNGVTGTWNPATVSNTATGTYIFTPDAGQCAVSATLTVTVHPTVIPAFTAIPDICSGSAAPSLPATSNNGITGTWDPAVVSNTESATYTFTPDPGPCAATATLSVTVNPIVIPVFNPIPATCPSAVAPVLPLISVNGITGTWDPPTVSNTATATYTFTPDAGQCATGTVVEVVAKENVVPVFAAMGPYCFGAATDILPATSLNGITGTWNPATVSNTATAAYTFTPDAGQCAVPTALVILVNPIVTTEFTSIPAFCSGTAAPLLPATSNNGITGTWDPALVSNTESATYTFTPDAGQCATTDTLNITVLPSVTPDFTAIPDICSGTAAPVLPSTSINGITGTWSPATVSNTATTTYTFTPDAGPCATPVTMKITVNPKAVPVFAAIPAICPGTIAPVLKATSDNGITGTWNPATVSNTASATYTFTPDAGQCATDFTMAITVSPVETPVFTAIPPICPGTLAPVLPTTSNNGITGTWDPSTVSNTETATYLFTPGAGQCATTASLTVTVNTRIAPDFTPVPAFCSGTTAPVLPTTSNNGITGTWDPATVSNTATATYTFTPDASQCSTPTSMEIMVTDVLVPAFAPLGPYCIGSAPEPLPAVSSNGITGTWSPAEIKTDVVGTAAFTFTPDGGTCQVPVTIDITVQPRSIPLFDEIGPVYKDFAVPVLATTSLNGISGTWSPATISSAFIGTFTFTFTPDASQCATSISIVVTVTDAIIPEFANLGPYCVGDTPDPLPLTSINGISGTWNPEKISTKAHGLFTYTFTPNANTGGVPITMEVLIISKSIPIFTAIGPLSQNSPAPPLPETSLNGFHGRWNPASISTAVVGTTAFTFTPDAGQCATVTSMAITITEVTVPLFASLGPYCVGSTPEPLPLTSLNGINGTWNPETINTEVAGIFTFIFTPDPNQSNIVVTVDIIIVPVVDPVFDQIGPICQNSTAPTLPLTSTNGITGTWNPAIVKTSGRGTSDYHFTPDPGQCANPFVMTIVVAAVPTVTITPVPPVCLGTGAITLVGTPSGGTFSGPGVTGTQFDPAQVGLGDYTITYRYINFSGCSNRDTIVVKVAEVPVVKVTDPAPVCVKSSVDLTDGAITTGSTANLTFTYWTDAGATVPLPAPAVAGAGIYYIKGTSPEGCSDIKPVNVTNSASVGIPVISGDSTRCQAAGTVIYPASAVNSTNLKFSLDPATLAGGNTINASTGAVTYKSTWSGETVIKVSAYGCNGPTIATLTVTTIPLATAAILYNGSPFCTTAGPVTVNMTGTPGGIYTASPVGLAIDPATGTIIPGSSAAGSYTVTYRVASAGGCGDVTATAQVRIDQSPDAAISYAGSPFCDNNTADQQAILTGTTGGKYSASPAGLSIHASTGAINPGKSQPGTYTVTYAISTSGACGPFTTTTTVTVDGYKATITYTGSLFCTSSVPVTVILAGSLGGEFTSSPSGLAIDRVTGTITPGSSQAGVYTVTYSKTSVGCGVITATALITITAAPQAEISYVGSPFCQSNESKQPVTLRGTSGGIYSAAPSGIVLDPATGEITPATSAAGTYLVTYTIAAAGGCEAFTATATVTITAIPTARIYYPGAPFCTSSLPVSVIFAGTTGGTYTSMPAGLSIDGTTGEITPATSAAGTYLVTYTISDQGCGELTTTAIVSVTLSPAAAISYKDSTFCLTDPPATPTITGTRGGKFTSSPQGLVIDSLSGEISIASSLPGDYLITYTIPASGGCGEIKATDGISIISSTIVTTSPKDQVIIYPANAGFGVSASGASLSYQWQVNTGTGFVNIGNTGVYSGAFTDSLTLASPPVSMSGSKYRVVVSGVCASPAISQEAVLIVTLKEFAITITATGIDKMYDGNTNATVKLFDNRQPGDSLIITYTEANFDTKNVGTDKPVFVSGIMVSGPDAGKYEFNTTTTTVADIIPKPITVTADPGLKKVYGAADPVFTYTYAPEIIMGDNFTGLLTRVPGENPGLYPILQGTLTLGDNYIITFISNDFEITYKTLINVIVTAGQTKVYGEVDPIITYTYYPPLEPGDFFTGQLSRAPGENVGEYLINRGTLTVSPKYGIFIAPSIFTITPKPITVTAVADIKVYDGTTASDEIPAITPGLAFDDTSEFIQVYDTKDVGTGKTMSPSGRVNDGNEGRNYTVTYKTVDLGTITPKPIIGSFTAEDKVYDATIAATISARSLEGAIRGDDVTYVGGTATFDTPNVGHDKTVTGTGFSLSGYDAGNYTVNRTATTQADILVLVLGTSLSVNASTFTHYSDQVTLTATVYGGAPLTNGPMAAGSTTFSIEGRVMRDDSNNADIPLVISGANLIATITVSLLETTITGSLVPGTKSAEALFNDENINYKLIPNPAKATFDFSPGFNIQVYPNPSPGEVNFKISVDVGAIVTLDLYASNGQLVAKLFEGFIPTGEQKIIPYHGYLAQGVYRYRARIGDEVKMGNVIIIRVY